MNQTAAQVNLPQTGQVDLPPNSPAATFSRGAPGVNPTPFINRAHVRQFLLEQSALMRAHRWTRVSEQTLINLSETVRRAGIAHIKSMPSKGKTL